VQYVGRISVTKYGEDILGIVNTYLTQNNLQGTSLSIISKEATKGKGVSETYQITFDLYRQGKSPEQIATERGYSLSTIMGHLGYFVKKGELPMSDFVTPSQQHAIQQAVAKVGTSHGLKAIKSNCSEEVTYDQIKIVLSI
jgi:ATP-dependent DNA helicase RecQ